LWRCYRLSLTCLETGSVTNAQIRINLDSLVVCTRKGGTGEFFDTFVKPFTFLLVDINLSRLVTRFVVLFPGKFKHAWVLGNHDTEFVYFNSIFYHLG
jgi:hypothetical protein